MRRHIIAYLAMLAVVMAALTSCSESEDTEEEFPNWQETNEKYFNNIYSTAQSNIEFGSASWKIIRSWSLEEEVATEPSDHIVVEVLEEGSGSGCPLYTDTVRVHYEGRLLPSTSYSDGYVFDKSFYDEYDPDTSLPSKLAVSAVIDGFCTALLNMHIGDRWRVYIPYQLGYSTTTSGSVPAYSTLIFDITLTAYYRPGEDVPDAHAAEYAGWVEE